VHKKTQIKVKDLSRFMLYILGHRPDEFGLVPDGKGFLSVKELLWAIHEESGWGYVRQSHLREVLLGEDRSLFETRGECIRASVRQWRQTLDEPVSDAPKILFVGVRRRAHPRAMEKGLSSPGGYLAFSPQREMALRIARRRDQKPVILEVMTVPAREQGVAFHSFGELFLADHIPASCITGPPVTEEMRQAVELARTRKEKPPEVPPFTPGSFVLDLSRDPDRARRAGGRKRKGWKEEARKMRREKG
jgi:putative RNA 2'-phosphotransferase